jgi:hypothetical protein
MRYITFVIILLLMVALPVIAQEDDLPLGEPVTGTLEGGTEEDTYTFTATAGDTIIAEVRATEEFSDLLSPYIIIQDAAGTVIAESSPFAFLSAQVIARIETDGRYSLTVTSSPDDANNTSGDYVLRVSLPTPITPGTPVSGSATGIDAAYYLLETTAPTVTVDYSRTAGDAFVPLSINTLDAEFGELIAVAALGGRLTRVSFDFVPQAETTRYIIAVGEFLAFDPTATDASFSLTITTP